jgi:putative aldouronate transport system permease protein
MKSRRDGFSPIANITVNLIFILASVLCIYPLFLVLGISISSEQELLRNGYSLLPQAPTLQAYQFIFGWSGSILKSYGVTIFVTVVGSTLSTLIIALFAYPLSRPEFAFRKQFAFYATFTMLFSGGMVPWYIVCVRFLNLTDSLASLIVPSLMSAFYVMIMRTFYSTTIPDAIVESARIDGCNEFYIWLRIVLPLVLPGLATIAFFNTLGYWNDYYLPLMLVTDQNYYNLQYMLYKLMVSLSILEQIPNADPNVAIQLAKLPGESARMAMCVISIGPIILAYPFFQKYFVKGLTIGAVKG